MMIDSASRSGSALHPTVEALSWRRGSRSASSTSGRYPTRQGVRGAMAAIPAAILASQHAAPAVASVKRGLQHQGAATAAALPASWARIVLSWTACCVLEAQCSPPVRGAVSVRCVYVCVYVHVHIYVLL